MHVRVLWVQATEADWGKVTEVQDPMRAKKGIECRCKGGSQGNIAEEGMFPLKCEEEAEWHSEVCMCEFVDAKQGAGQTGGR